MVLTRIVAVTLCVALVLVATGCGSTAVAPSSDPASGSAPPDPSDEMTVFAPGGTYTSVGPRRLATMLTTKDFVLVNVHIPYEGEIDGTDAFIPFDDIGGRLAELPAVKASRIFVYCRSGTMSTAAARTLVGLGYTNVWELDGGMIAWEAAGFELVRRPPS